MRGHGDFLLDDQSSRLRASKGRADSTSSTRLAVPVETRAAAQRPFTPEEAFAASAAKAPIGYCDLEGAPRGASPCELDPQTRRAYRARVRDDVGAIQISWSLAIVSHPMITQLEKGELAFHPRLGQLILRAPYEVIASSYVPAAPADLSEFLEAMRNAPTLWSSNLVSNVSQLFDADLAALLAGLPDPGTVTRRDFANQITASVKRFEREHRR